MCDFIIEPAMLSLKLIIEQENLSLELPETKGKTTNELVRIFKALRYELPGYYEVISHNSKRNISNKDGVILALDICNDLIADLIEYRDSVPVDHDAIEKLTRENNKLKAKLKRVKNMINSSLSDEDTSGDLIEDEIVRYLNSV